MSELSYGGGDGSSHKKPHEEAEQPKATLPEARRQDSGEDAGQHDAAAGESVSSRQFRDSKAETLDKATMFKRLDHDNSGRLSADSTPQGPGKSFFSSLRDSLLGDRGQAPLAFMRFGSGPDRDNPNTKPEQPVRKPPETRRQDTSGDAGKAQSGQHDATPEKSTSSRQFRDSQAGTLDKATTFKRLDQSYSGQSLAESGSQRADCSFFSQLRERLQGDQDQSPLTFMRFGAVGDGSGVYRAAEREPAAEKKPYDNPFQREPRSELHDGLQAQRDQSKNTAENKVNADIAQSDQNKQSKEQLTDNAAIRRAEGSQSPQGPKEATPGDATDKNRTPDSGNTDKARPDAPDGDAFNYVQDLLLAHYETARSNSLEHDQSFTPHIIAKASLGAIIAPLLDARAWENVTPFSGPAPSVIVESYRLRRGEENRVNFYPNGDVSHVTLTGADFEKALLWGQPNQSQLNEFEKSLVAGQLRRSFSDVKLLVDPEGGTVGYKVFWGQGGTSAGNTIFSRYGDMLAGSIGPGLEPPDFWPMLAGSVALGAAKAATESLLRDIGGQLGNILAKDEVEHVSANAANEAGRAAEEETSAAVSGAEKRVADANRIVEHLGVDREFKAHFPAFAERGILMYTEQPSFVVRAGPPGSYGDHIFSSSEEARTYAEQLAARGETEIRNTSSLPYVRRDGAVGNPVDAVRVFEVPENMPYIAGVVGEQLEGTVAPILKIYVGGGPQAVIPRDVKLGTPVYEFPVTKP